MIEEEKIEGAKEKTEEYFLYIKCLHGIYCSIIQ